MTTTPTRTANSKPPAPIDQPQQAESVPQPPKLRRRPLLAVVAGALVLAGGLGGVWAWQSSTSTIEVVATRTAIPRGDTIDADQLMVVRVNPDPALRVIAAHQLAELAGQRAVTDLVAGGLLAAEQVSDALPPATGLSVVGVSPAVGFVPAEPLRAGDAVRVVQTPGAQADVVGEPVALPAEVLAVREVEGRMVVDVLVPSALAPEIAARAATGRVALVLDARER